MYRSKIEKQIEIEKIICATGIVSYKQLCLLLQELDLELYITLTSEKNMIRHFVEYLESSRDVAAYNKDIYVDSETREIKDRFTEMVLVPAPE